MDTTTAGQPLSLCFIEGLGLQPPDASWPQDLPLRDGVLYALGATGLNPKVLDALERAHNAGFVEASRLHGQEIERLRTVVQNTESLLNHLMRSHQSATKHAMCERVILQAREVLGLK